MSQSQPTDQKALLYSEFGDDPDLGELVELFVEEMEGRIAALQHAFDESDLNTLGVLAHQLKGASGSYGFSQLTPAAYAVERAARTPASMEEIADELAELVDMLGRTRAGTPTSA